MIGQALAENVKFFKLLGQRGNSDARCTREIKSRVVMAKAAFNMKQNLFTSEFDLNLRIGILHLEHCLVRR
jgi:hypothetical protein